MTNLTRRQLTTTMMMASAAAMVPSFAGEAPAAGAPYVIPPKTKDVIKKAIENPNRTPEMRARDVLRRPADVLTLSEVKANSRVIEFAPVGFYYSTLLSNVIGAKGNLHMYELPFMGEQEPVKAAAQKFLAEHPNAKYEVVDLNKAEFPRNVDLVFSVWAFHDQLLTNVEMTAFHAKLFKAMKPGATYLVIDHAAKLGTETNDTGRLHRIDPGTLRGTIQSNGFELVEDSRILYRPDDDHTWSVHTEGKRDMTDQAVFKFKKPIVY